MVDRIVKHEWLIGQVEKLDVWWDGFNGRQTKKEGSNFKTITLKSLFITYTRCVGNFFPFFLLKKTCYLQWMVKIYLFRVLTTILFYTFCLFFTVYGCHFKRIVSLFQNRSVALQTRTPSMRKSGNWMESGLESTAGKIKLPILVILTFFWLVLLYETVRCHAAKSPYHVFERIIDVFWSMHSSNRSFVVGCDHY